MQDYSEIFDLRGHAYNDAVNCYPDAREAERQALLDLVDLTPGLTVADAPAGGGYVADGIHRRLGPDVLVICIEPSVRFAAAIDQRSRVVRARLDQTGLPSGSLDAVFSLAGLHHLADRQSVYREWARLLKPSGRLAIADVEAGTGTAEFLNVFVHQYTPGGHEGMFLGEGELTRHLAEAGFSEVRERRKLVPWQFSNRQALVNFCRKLFMIEAAPASIVEKALADYVGIQQDASGECCLSWQLRYADATRGC